MADGINIKTIQTVMRHATIGLTLDAYGHLMPGSVLTAGQSLASRLSPSDPQNLSTGGISWQPRQQSPCGKNAKMPRI